MKLMQVSRTGLGKRAIGAAIVAGLALATLSTTLGTFDAQPAGAAVSRDMHVCQTQTTAVTNWNVYQVCLTATDSYDGTHATGYVSNAYCNVYLPTGAGWYCHGFTKGSYWNSAKGAWEDWLNYRVSYLSPLAIYKVTYSNCIYLRVDTKPNGSTTYQNFNTKNLPSNTTC